MFLKPSYCFIPVNLYYTCNVEAWTYYCYYRLCGELHTPLMVSEALCGELHTPLLVSETLCGELHTPLLVSEALCGEQHTPLLVSEAGNRF